MRTHPTAASNPIKITELNFMSNFIKLVEPQGQMITTRTSQNPSALVLADFSLSPATQKGRGWHLGGRGSTRKWAMHGYAV